MTTLRRLLGSLALVAAVHLVAPRAHAAKEGARERAAKKACLSSDVAKGVAILADLYLETANPVYIFNQGRCFEQNAKYEEAIARFREFVLKSRAAGHESDQGAEEHIANCQAMLNAQRQGDKASSMVAVAPPPPTITASTVPPAVSPDTATDGATGQAAAQSQPETVRSKATTPGSGLRIAGIGAVALGVAGITGGIILNLKANSLANELETKPPYQRSKEDTRASYETWGWASYIVGGGGLAGGAILYYLGYAQGRDTQVALLPALGPGSVGAALQGGF